MSEALEPMTPPADRPLTYLACPYSHPNSKIQHERFVAANRAAAELIRKGKLIFSPISHSHPIALEGGLPVHWEFWDRFCRAYMSHCNEMIVLRVDGWEQSVGVSQELIIAGELGIPVFYMDPK